MARRINFASMFNDITDYTSKKVQVKCLDRATEVASFAALVLAVSVVQDGTDLENTTIQDLLLNLLTGSVTNSLLC